MNILDRFIHPDIEQYIEAHTSKEDDVLMEIDRQTHVKMIRPRMLSGSYQGQLLSFISQMLSPFRILEIGTYVGYSAICLSQGLPAGGRLTTIEVDEELEDIILLNLKKAKVSHQVELRIGNAIDILPTLEGSFDLIFIDADKYNYLRYYEMCMPLLQSNGYMIIDNVLWSGKVLYPQPKGDKETAVLKQLNENIQSDHRVKNILLPIRDGLMLVQKL